VTGLRFEWNERKNAENQRKHRVSFEEAETVFLDEFALLIDDRDHSSREQRFVLLGIGATLRHLVVCHCYRASETVIALFGAKSDGAERKTYLERWSR
jgi:uncharacterized DUF497 family protein